MNTSVWHSDQESAPAPPPSPPPKLVGEPRHNLTSQSLQATSTPGLCHTTFQQNDRTTRGSGRFFTGRQLIVARTPLARWWHPGEVANPSRTSRPSFQGEQNPRTTLPMLRWGRRRDSNDPITAASRPLWAGTAGERGRRTWETSDGAGGIEQNACRFQRLA